MFFRTEMFWVSVNCYILRANIVPFTHYIDWHTIVTSYFSDNMLHQEEAVAQEAELFVKYLGID